MTKPLRFENKSLRLKYKCLICIWIIFWAILDLFINPKYLFQNKSFSQTYYFKSEKSFVILTSLLGLKINPGNLQRYNITYFVRNFNEFQRFSLNYLISCGRDGVRGWSALILTLKWPREGSHGVLPQFFAYFTTVASIFFDRCYL